MKTFEEGEWLAYRYDMWIVKEIRQEGKSISYTISDGAVDTSISPNDKGTFKLTLSIKNLIDDFQGTKKNLRKSATHGVERGLNWPHLHALFSHHFEILAGQLEKYEGDFQNAKFKKKYEEDWENYQTFVREWIDAIKKANNMAVDGVSLFST